MKKTSVINVSNIAGGMKCYISSVVSFRFDNANLFILFCNIFVSFRSIESKR